MREGWRRVPLGEVAWLAVDRVTVERSGLYRMAGVLNAGQGVFERDAMEGSATAYPTLHRLHAGQLVMRKLTAWEGPIAVVAAEHDGCHASTEFPTFALDHEQLLPKYMGLLCQTPALWLQMKERATGSVQRRKRVSPSQLLSVVIDLPPMDEQRRIVDLISALDRQVVLSALLDRHAETTLASLLRTEMERAHRAGTEQLGDLSTARLGKMLSKASKTGADEHPYVRNADVQWDRINWHGLNTMLFTDREQTEFRLQAGDVLVCEGGEVGRAAVVPRDMEGVYFQKAIHRVRCGDRLRPRFLMHYLRYCALTGRFADYVSRLTIQHLTGEKLRTLPIPVPSLARQDRTVELLDAVSAVRHGVSNETARALALRSSLLADLLSGNHEIPESYDRFLGAA